MQFKSSLLSKKCSRWSHCSVGFEVMLCPESTLSSSAVTSLELPTQCKSMKPIIQNMEIKEHIGWTRIRRGHPLIFQKVMEVEGSGDLDKKKLNPAEFRWFSTGVRTSDRSPFVLQSALFPQHFSLSTTKMHSNISHSIHIMLVCPPSLWFG